MLVSLCRRPIGWDHSSVHWSSAEGGEVVAGVARGHKCVEGGRTMREDNSSKVDK